ncbi:hypothetical protein Ancab_010465 [Ancistrocladus abbreviatus]
MRKASLGWGHALAQTIDGKLYGWGFSADGRLGLLGDILESSPLDSVPDTSRTNQHSGNALDAAEKFVRDSIEKENNMPIIWEPRFLEELQSVEVIDIACGLDHSLVLCPGLGHSMAICKGSPSDVEKNARKVVTWGWDHNSQLGRAGPENLSSVVEGLEEEGVCIHWLSRLKVSCGSGVVEKVAGCVHSLALTSEGELWVWGCGKSGRLISDSSFDEPEPMLADMQGNKVLQAVAGFDHNLPLVTEP